ncbi:FAD/NAD(P)-binding domain-containing protein [Pyrenochaeta sp. DS3sAY3a]|nr:FAD/NAD(P)-binding domain-containing protein [Pyrenochaeta sp. DS3sAY3a]
MIYSKYQYAPEPLGHPRPVRVAIIGAGVSGIAAVKMFKEKFQGTSAELVLYEKNSDVGGTWLENRYPGCACDVPAHAYTYSWEGNPNWSKAYVGAVELFDYFKSRAVAYGVEDFVHLNHLVEQAIWKEDEGLWELQVLDQARNIRFITSAECLINAAGFLNNWKWPDVPNLTDFQGHLVHSAHWDDTYIFQNKRVAIIGSGSSAIQIVPQLQPVVDHMVSFNRSATWITPEFAAEFAPEGRDVLISSEQQREWRDDPKAFLEFRKKVESTMNQFFDLQYKDSELQKDSFERYRLTMKHRLAKKPGLAEHLIPEFAVGCRRITPGHHYLESLASENVTVECGEISSVRANGIEMKDGPLHEVDALICATGFDTSFKPAFPVIGLNGCDLRKVWEVEPRSYLSIAASGFPNYFVASGPNFPLANGGLIPCLEKNIEYAFKAVERMQRTGIKSMHPKVKAVDDFQEHKDSLMEDLVWSAPCRSWYKNGNVDGKVWGPWPGSSLHYLELMSEPRWEDWEIEYTSKNRFAFLGNGKSSVEANKGDLAHYLREPGCD